MTIFRQDLVNQGVPASPVADPLKGLRPLKRAPADAVMRAQDHVVTTGRRIVASGGLHGSEAWRVPDDDPETAGNTHPQVGTTVTLHATSIDVTPGCFLRLRAIVLPCGETQVFDPGTGGNVAAGTVGALRCSITWTDRDGNTQSRAYTVPLPPNSLEHGAEPSGAGAMYLAIQPVQSGLMAPDNVAADSEELARWCQHVRASIAVSAVGSPRVIDWHVYEEPFAVAMAHDAPIATSHAYGLGNPDGPGIQLTHPHDQRTADDPRYGTTRLLDVSAEQRLRLGPVLVEWSSYSEDKAGPTDGWEPVEVTSDSLWLNSPYQGASYDPAFQGWSMGCAGYARRHDDNGDLVLRGRTATIPVYVRAYAQSVTNAGTVRFQTSPDSYVDVAVPVGDPGMRVAYGHLEVPVNPSQHKPLQVQVIAAGTTRVWSVSVHRADQWSPA